MKKNLLCFTLVFSIIAYANPSKDQISKSEKSTDISVDDHINSNASNDIWLDTLLAPAKLNITDEDILASLKQLETNFDTCVQTFNAGACDEQKVWEDYLILQKFYFANAQKDTPLANKITENITRAKARIKELSDVKVKFGVIPPLTNKVKSVSQKDLEKRYNKTLANSKAGTCTKEEVLIDYLQWQDACLADTPVDSVLYKKTQKSIIKAKLELVTILKLEQKNGQDVDLKKLKELEKDIELPK